MPRYRIRIDRLDTVPDTQPKWVHGAGEGGKSGYVTPPEGCTKDVTDAIFDQTMDSLEVHRLVCAINTPAPAGFGPVPLGSAA